jgi:pyrroline-5-carboxylate reductase
VTEAADLVILAVKPNVLDEVAGDLVETGTPVLSILAGTTLETLSKALPGIELVRVMPNLGAQLRQAVLCVAYPEGTDQARRQQVDEMLGLLGEVIELDEDLIDAATAIMGCSPGYLALMAEVLLEAGVEEGLTEDQTLRMLARAMSATGGLLEQHHPTALKEAVASPGGMTEAGLNALEEREIHATLKAAVEASLERVRG